MRFVEQTTADITTPTSATYAVSPTGPITIAISLVCGTDLGAQHTVTIYGSLSHPEDATQWYPLLAITTTDNTARLVPYPIQGLRFDVAVSASVRTSATGSAARAWQAYWAVLQGDNS